MILFRATSHHQLINAIAIKLQYCRDEQADLMLSNHTDFSNILDNIRSCGIFRNVYYVDDVKVSSEFLALSPDQRLEASKHITNMWDVEPDCEYSDYYYGHNILANKFYYYYLVGKQGSVIPHSFQEGTSSYLADPWAELQKGPIAHGCYGENSLLNKLADLYMYLPDKLLYTSPVEVKPIDISTDELRSIVKQIYQPPALPKQKYIYIAVCSEFHNLSSNESALVEYIGDLVGKDNLVIKNHPRSSIDKFSYRGFSVMDSSIAFEAYLMDPAIKDKILIAPLSTALMSAEFMLDDFRAIICKELLACDHSRFVPKGSMNVFLKNMTESAVNSDGSPSFYYAKNKQHFSDIITYLRGKEKMNAN